MSSSGSSNSSPGPFTSWAVANGITYSTDVKKIAWYREPGKNWKTMSGLGSSIAPFGRNQLAIISTGFDLFVRSRPISGEWRKIGGANIQKLAGNVQGELWLMADSNHLFRWNGAVDSFARDDETGKILDLSIRDRVYVVQTGNLVCSRSFATARDRVCSVPPFNPVKIAVSDGFAFVLADDGRLFSTKLPLTRNSNYFDTGYLADNPNFMAVPVDGNQPFVVKADGTVDEGFCQSRAFSCFSPQTTEVPSPTKVPSPIDTPKTSFFVSLTDIEPSESPTTRRPSSQATSQTIPPPLPSQTLRSSTNDTTTSNSDSPLAFPIGGIIGIVFGVVVFATIVTVFFFIYNRKREKTDGIFSVFQSPQASDEGVNLNDRLPQFPHHKSRNVLQGSQNGPSTQVHEAMATPYGPGLIAGSEHSEDRKVPLWGAGQETQPLDRQQSLDSKLSVHESYQGPKSIIIPSPKDGSPLVSIAGPVAPPRLASNTAVGFGNTTVVEPPPMYRDISQRILVQDGSVSWDMKER
ncbi:hypothetical protein HDU97_004507 [Phlyctochytrium planicorne]|nr:hypothetical protein HDU97_004507 [Phlyctochytrium planicorne]